MSNALYDYGRQGFLDGSIAWTTPTIKAALVRGYTPSLSTHEFVSDVTGVGGGTLVSTSAALTSKTVTAGVANAQNAVFSAVTAGAACPYIIIFQSSAVTGGSDIAATGQRLIALIDTATGLPITPNGGDITSAWDTGTNKIFKL